MAATKIEWTTSTWNPVTGCSKISAGCKNCYAERMAKRLMAMGQPNYQNGFEVTTHECSLHIPLMWKKPRLIFVNSMGDLFHEKVSSNFIQAVFRIMNQADWHHYQILTKRARRLSQLSKHLPWNDHIWMGVTVENSDVLSRIESLRNTEAKVKFLSCEPLLGSLAKIDLTGIDWVIVGGESGPGARPVRKEWILEIRDICQEQNVPFFFKQWGGTFKKKNGRLLEGRIYDEMPNIRIPAFSLS
ncbi:MAG TPA: phage Gp37/Gp68 family protein [bacterium]|mgnify:FL=1|nr:phage Gp37/Gp68 family protein [bacterium]